MRTHLSLSASALSRRERHTSSHPTWLRRLALGNTLVFVWSFLLFTPAYALTHQPPKSRLGIRSLSLQEMARIRGSLHQLSARAESGSTYPWEASVHSTNTANGNKLTSHTIVRWTARGGLPVALVLNHNSQSNHNSELGQKWTHSFDLYGIYNDLDGSVTLHWGDAWPTSLPKTWTAATNRPPAFTIVWSE